MKEKKTEKAGGWLVALIGVLGAVIIAAVLWFALRDPEPAQPVQTPEPVRAATPTPFVTPEPETVVVYQEVEKRVEVEKVFTGAMIQERLNDIGILLTEAYDFTDVVSYSSSKSIELFGSSIELPFSESSYIFSYDGTVNAGLDFGAVSVKIIETKKMVRVYLPKASVQNVVIDFDSFQLYDEHAGLFNPISVADYNRSMAELEAHAEQKALAKGILDRADANAERLITSIVASLIDTAEYEIVFVEAK